jgi:hypothetical protein
MLLQGALAHRVLGLLWELTFAPGAPAEVAQSPVLSDSLHHYAGMGSNGIDMVWDYITRCISQVETGWKTLGCVKFELPLCNSWVQCFCSKCSLTHIPEPSG